MHGRHPVRCQTAVQHQPTAGLCFDPLALRKTQHVIKRSKAAVVHVWPRSRHHSLAHPQHQSNRRLAINKRIRSKVPGAEDKNTQTDWVADGMINAYHCKVSATVKWVQKDFSELSGAEVYQILALRLQVFVVEQTCHYQDADGSDLVCIHLCGYDSKGLVAYARLIPPGEKYPEASIGRVVIAPRARGTGIGKQLMIESMRRTREHFSIAELSISAQAYLIAFYQDLGFAMIGEQYLEDGIPHIEMRYQHSTVTP
jgi:ElaA protein